MYGCMGRILFVDLAKGSFSELQLQEELYRDFAGGIGLAARILLDEIPAGADPLGPLNVLAFMSGALTGTGALMTGRWMVACKSPLTGGWGEANCGGNFSPAIKRCGYDGIFFKGIAAAPVLFVCDDEGPRLEPAQEYWGKDAIETEELLSVRYKGKNKPAIAAIGYAAEKLSLISGISNDGGRYAARSGVGAVMGSKKLKALILAGSKKISCADPAKVAQLSKDFAAKVGKADLPSFIKGKHLAFAGAMIGLPLVVRINGLMGTAFFKRWGTIYNNTGGVVNGDTPIGNWALGPSSFPKEKREKLNPDYVIARETKKYRCYSCAIGCGGICDMKDLDPKGGHTHKPEYETHAAFGPLLLNDDLASIFRCNDICNRSGLDTISAGSTIAFALECMERGLIPKNLLGDARLAWGDSAAIEAFLRLMANREGIGALFADGTREAAKRLGLEGAEFAVHAGGQEPGMHDPRLDPHLGVAFTADPTPGRHTISAGLYYNLIRLWRAVSWAPAAPLAYPRSIEAKATEEEALKSVAGTLYKQVADMAGGCLFAMLAGIESWNLFNFFNAATGRNLSPDEYMEMGRRSQTLRQLFNIKQGLDPRSTMLPGRLYGEPPLQDGPLQGKSFPLAEKVALHWKFMGWNAESGFPEPETLAGLGLDDLVAKQLPEKLGRV